MKNFTFEVENGNYCFHFGNCSRTYLEKPSACTSEELDYYMQWSWSCFSEKLRDIRHDAGRPVTLADILQKMVEDEDDPALMDDFDLYPWERFRGSDPCFLSILLAVLQENGGRIPSGYLRHPSKNLAVRYYAWLLKASQTEGVKKVPITL